MAKDAQGPTSATEQPDYADSEIHVVCSAGNASDDPEDARQRVDSSDHPPGSLHLPHLPLGSRSSGRTRDECVTRGTIAQLVADAWAEASQEMEVRSRGGSDVHDHGRPVRNLNDHHAEADFAAPRDGAPNVWELP